MAIWWRASSLWGRRWSWWSKEQRKLRLDHLAHRVARQCLHASQRTRHLGRSKPRLRPFAEVGELQLMARPELDRGADFLAPLRIVHTQDGALGHGRMRAQH